MRITAPLKTEFHLPKWFMAFFFMLIEMAFIVKLTNSFRYFQQHWWYLNLFPHIIAYTIIDRTQHSMY